MRGEEYINIVTSEFERLVGDFCRETDGLSFDVYDKYKGKHDEKILKYRSIKVFYYGFVIEFRYSVHAKFSNLYGILDSVLYFDKTEKAIGVPLPYVADFCDVNSLNPLCVPCIATAEAMRQAFCSVSDVMKLLTDKCWEISNNADLKDKLLSYYINELSRMTNSDISAFSAKFSREQFVEYLSYFSEDTPKAYFSSGAFFALLKGNRDKAIKMLAKKKNKLSYEKRMLKLLKTSSEIPDMPNIKEALDDYNELGVQKASGKEWLSFFVSCLALIPTTSLYYFAVFFILDFLDARDTVLMIGGGSNWPVCLFAAFVTAIALSWFTRFRFYRLLYKKDFRKYFMTDSFVSGGSDKFMRIFLAVTVSFALVFCLFTEKSNVRFLNDGFTDNSSFWSLKGEHHDYDEIRNVFYRPDRKNAFGDTIDGASYVILLKNGKEIDLYETEAVEIYESELLRFLKDRGIEVKTDKNT